MAGTLVPPVSDATGEDRGRRQAGLWTILAQAGYRTSTAARLVKNNEPLAFEIMVKDRAQERLALAYKSGLHRIGVEASVRLVDEGQYQRRRQHFDFDVMIGAWAASASPGNEQRSRWGSASADQEASFNLAGVRSPAVDGLIDAMLAATSREDFLRCRAGLRSRPAVGLLHRAAVSCLRDSGSRPRRRSRIPPSSPRYGAPVSATFDTWWRKLP